MPLMDTEQENGDPGIRVGVCSEKMGASGETARGQRDSRARMPGKRSLMVHCGRFGPPASGPWGELRSTKSVLC